MATVVPISKSPLPCSTQSPWSSSLSFWTPKKAANFVAWTTKVALPLALLFKGLQRRATMRHCRSRTSPAYGSIPNPRTLYDFLGVDHRADTSTIRKAYLAKQKMVHPDVAGDNAQEVSMLLNSAFDVLRDPEKRSAYDASLHIDPHVEDDDDDGPTWPWTAKERRGEKVIYKGRPRSRSLWERVPDEDRGDRWEQQKFLFIDELKCISCWNCVECAPKSICMDADHVRARVYAQWGNSKDDLEWAVKSCPVECISWVSRQELQVLEHVTAEHMNSMGCVRHRPFTKPTHLPHLAEKWVERRRRDSEMARKRMALASKHFNVTMEQFQQQLRSAMLKLPPDLRQAAFS